MLRISDAANIAFHAMGNMACAEEDTQVNGQELAERLHVSSNHLAKVMQRLSKAKLVESRRGPKGGFKLGKDSKDITLLDIYEAIEGPLIHTDCLMGNPVCSSHKCLMKPLIHSIPQMIHDHLSKTTLASVLIDKQAAEASDGYFQADNI